MSKAVDNKVVSMSMDNSDLLSKASQSLKAITGLDNNLSKVKGVDMSGTTKGLSSISSGLEESSGKASGLGKAVDSIKSHFSALGVIATTALMNITNRAINAGMNLAKSFTVQPIMAGMSMYENKLKSIQVMLSNTQGKSSIGDITKSLGELNDYANKTVYSFEDMTTNMGTFTSAGVDLKTAQDAIQGIGNLAAASGSGTQQAATAMYQLSQAIASGKVGLQDWNSVVNAGMGGKKFQTALQENAKAMGKNVDATKSFRDSLQDGWLTTDVLMKTLRQFKNDKSMQEAATQSKTFSDAMDTLQDQLKSGWANTWEALIGGYESAPKIWTAFANGIGDMINKSAEARTKLASDFVALGGRTQVINVLVNGFHLLQQVVGEVSKGFHDVFPAITAKSLYNIVTAINVFIAKAYGAQSTIKALRGVSQGFFSIIDLGIKAVGALAKIIITLIPDHLVSVIIQAAGALGKMIFNFDKGMNSGKDLSKALDNVHDSVNDLFDGLVKGIQKAGGFVGAIVSIGKAVATWIAPYFSAAASAIGNFIKSFTFKDLLAAGGVGALGSIALSIKKFRGAIGDLFDKFTSFLDKGDEISGVLSTLTDSLKSMTTAFKAATLVEIAAAVMAIAVALKILSGLSYMDISKGLEVVVLSLYGMTKTLNAISKMNFGTGTFKAVMLIQSITLAILGLSVSLKILASIDAADLGKAMLGLAATMVILIGGVKALSNAGGKMAVSSFQLGALAIAILGLTASLKILSTISVGDLVKSILALGAVFLELAAFVKIVNNTKLSPTTSIGVVLIAQALVIISGALAILGMIDTDSMVKALISMAAVLAEIALFAKAMQGNNILGAAVGVNAVAIALNLMIPPIEAFGHMDLAQIGTALLTMGGALTEVVIAMKAASGGLAGAVAITVVAGALNLLVIPIEALGRMSIQQIAIALGAFAVTLGTVAIAANLIGVGGSVALLAFAAAIGAVGLAMTGIGLALGAFTLAVTALSAMTTAELNSVIRAFSTLLSGLTNIVPQIVTFGVTLVTQFAAGIAQAAPALAESGLQMIQGLLQAISDHIGDITTLVLQIITTFINALADNVGQVVEAAVNFIVKVIDGMANAIRDNSDQIIGALMNLIESILELIITAIQQLINTTLGWIPGVKSATASMGDGAKSALRDAFNVKDVGDKGGKDFEDGINSHSGGAKNAGKNLADNAHSGASTSLNGEGTKAGITYVGGVAAFNGQAHGAGSGLKSNAKNGATGSFDPLGRTAGGSYATGIGGTAGSAHTAGAKIASSGKSGAKVSFHSEGSYAGQGFVEGIGSWVNQAAKKAQELAQTAKNWISKVLDEHSPSRVTHQLGVYFSQGFANGIGDASGLAENQSRSLAQKAADATARIANTIQDSLNNNIDMQPTITPVLDLSGIKNPNLNLASSLQLAGNVNSAYTTPVQETTQQITFGDISINISSPDAQTASDTMETFKTKFYSVLTDELRKVKKVN